MIATASTICLLLLSTMMVVVVVHAGDNDDHSNNNNRPPPIDDVRKHCIQGRDMNQDQFPHKVYPVDSEYWDVTYHTTYKIVTNKAVNESYLLYQCGTPPPTGSREDPAYKHVFRVPLDAAGVGPTPTLEYFSQLGLTGDILAFLTDPTLIGDACFQKMIEHNKVWLIQAGKDDEDESIDGRGDGDGDNQLIAVNNETLTKLSNDTEELLEQLAVFLGDYQTDDDTFPNTVQVSEYREKTNKAIFEWIKFYGAFFNLEPVANDIVDLAAMRWDCVAEQAAANVEPDEPTPTVFWAYYSSYCGGWDIGECPNYYCEYVTTCSAEMVLTDAVGSIEACGTHYWTTDELVEIGKDADTWIFPSDTWDEAYSLFNASLDQMKSVQNRQVYDYLKSGSNEWFEDRYAEYYEVLADVCSVVVVNTTVMSPPPPPPPDLGDGDTTVVASAEAVPRTWLRNVFYEPVGNSSKCLPPSSHGGVGPSRSILHEKYQNDQCAAMLSESSSGSSASTLVALVAITMTMGALFFR